MTFPLPDVVLYSRAGCGLCDEARETLQVLLHERVASGAAAAVLVERDIAADADLEAALFDRIPVVEVGGQRLELSASRLRLRRLLEDALDLPRVAAG